MVNHSFKVSVLTAILISTNATANSPAGKTIITRGDVTATEQQQVERKLRRRSPIFDVDTVNTQANSKAQFRMSDGSLLAVKENTQVNVAQYKYQAGAEDNSMVIELVKGGLRSVTGAIKENSGSYELKTPVGSIGIRGTHYEVEIVDGDLFLAVWDGAIDLTVDTSSGSDVVSFGEGEDFSFGIVTNEGEVTELLEPPETFNSGHSIDVNSGAGGDTSESDDPSSTNNDEQASSSSDTTQTDSTGPSSTNDETDDGLSEGLEDNTGTDQPTTTETPTTDQSTGETLGESLNQETFDSLTPTPPEVVAAMQGNTSLSGIVESTVESSAGAITNFSVNMNINFDTTFVEGDLSATDAGGEWFAVYQGFIDQNQLALGITQATYGSELAQGQIGGFFTDDATKIFGNFDLTEINNPNNTISGNFLLE